MTWAMFGWIMGASFVAGAVHEWRHPSRLRVRQRRGSWGVGIGHAVGPFWLGLWRSRRRDR
jgi:heme/copper-type cytochrome/quinol oxidase subunit 3